MRFRCTRYVGSVSAHGQKERAVETARLSALRISSRIMKITYLGPVKQVPDDYQIPEGLWPSGSLSRLDEDVVCALLNLGCSRPMAESAIRKARASGAPEDFEPLFRKALELTR